MADQDDSVEIGKQRARDILDRRATARARRADVLAAHEGRLDFKLQISTPTGPLATTSMQTAGFLVAAGDSWFDYPIYDVLKLLEDNYGYDVESAAHRGDPIEAMAYADGQLDKFSRSLDKVIAHGAVPKAVLLSGGGDDIAGAEFGMLLNSAVSNIAGWNDQIVDAVINSRILAAYQTMITAITEMCQARAGKVLPILIHGYDFPVPDGRGFLGGWFFLPGPWLEPGFHEKLFNALPDNVAMMQAIIGKFNQMLVGLVQDPRFAHVRFVDLRGTLSNDLTDDAYKTWWGNELHPTLRGFTAVADKFAAELSKL